MKSTTVQLLQSSDLTNKISPEVSDIQSGSLANSEGASACRKSMFFQKKCLFSIPIPKPLPLGKGLSVGLPPSPRLGLRPKPHFQKLYRFIDSPAPSQTVRELFCHPSRTAYPLRKNINIHIDLNFTFRYYFPYPVLILSVKSVTASS